MRPTGHGLLLLAALSLLACDDDAGDGAGDGTSDSAGDTGSADELPPQGEAAMEAWLAGGAYLDWAAESAVHASAGPHGAGVRTFVNAAMLSSFEAGNAEHPVGAALVKELYDDAAITGFAVMVKVADGQQGDGWYWYERLGTSIVADGNGVALCTGCHSAGTDLVQTPFPLQ